MKEQETNLELTVKKFTLPNAPEMSGFELSKHILAKGISSVLMIIQDRLKQFQDFLEPVAMTNAEKNKFDKEKYDS